MFVIFICVLLVFIVFIEILEDYIYYFGWDLNMFSWFIFYFLFAFVVSWYVEILREDIWV